MAMAAMGGAQAALIMYQLIENENAKARAEKQRNEDLQRAIQWRGEDYERADDQEKRGIERDSRAMYNNDFSQRASISSQARTQLQELQTGLPAQGANLRNL